jgi:hypothetical protein
VSDQDYLPGKHLAMLSVFAPACRLLARLYGHADLFLFGSTSMLRRGLA